MWFSVPNKWERGVKNKIRENQTVEIVNDDKLDCRKSNRTTAPFMSSTPSYAKSYFPRDGDITPHLTFYFRYKAANSITCKKIHKEICYISI